jgi:threonine dehydrogenase-like Zn-dependent dehydrogenase
MLLVEIGEDGQRRLGAAVAAVAGNGLTHAIATAYAERAGIGKVVAGAIDEARLAPAFLQHAAPRAMVAGSRAALAAFRDAIFAEGGADHPS